MPQHSKHARATTSLSSIDPPLHLVPSSSPWSVHLWFSSSTLRRAVEADLHSPCRCSSEFQIASSEESSWQGHNQPHCLGVLHLRPTADSVSPPRERVHLLHNSSLSWSLYVVMQPMRCRSPALSRRRGRLHRLARERPWSGSARTTHTWTACRHGGCHAPVRFVVCH
jgi:hypothetical protein